MRTFRDDDGIPDDAHGAIWAIGNFDGLHRGHQALFARARAAAQSKGVHAGVLTFEPHPAKVLNPSLAPPLILTAPEKEQGIERAGIDELCILRFDRALASLAPADFVRRVLVERLHAGGVVVGDGFRFGHKAAGTVDDLRRALPVVEVVGPVKEGGLVCSSSKIRELVLEGKVDQAARLLGHAYELAGTVVVGDRRGHTIGIPTANVETQRELLPKLGVYATRATVDGKTYASVTNIGLRPTFTTGAPAPRIEAHLLGFSGDIYGKQLALDVVARIRDEMRFPGVDALKAQIAKDIDDAKRILAERSA